MKAAKPTTEEIKTEKQFAKNGNSTSPSKAFLCAAIPIPPDTFHNHHPGDALAKYITTNTPGNAAIPCSSENGLHANLHPCLLIDLVFCSFLKVQVSKVLGTESNDILCWVPSSVEHLVVTNYKACWMKKPSGRNLCVVTARKFRWLAYRV